MENNSQTEKKKKKGSFLSWLLWWRIDQDELAKQVSEYHSLKITKSIRGQSLLLLIFSACVTTAFIVFSNFPIESYFDVFISILLGYFIYRGHRWAMIGAMLFWSLEKFYIIYEGIQSYSPTTHSSSNPLIHIIWWALYMHAFYFSFSVEQFRHKEIQSQIAVAIAPSVSHFNELERLSELKNKGIITEEEFNAKKKGDVF
jgi:hypothetical protein